MKKFVKRFVFVFVLVQIVIAISSLMGCGKKSDNQGVVKVPAEHAVIDDKSGNPVGYFLGFSQGTTTAYVLTPTNDVVQINLVTGAYISERITCATADCAQGLWSRGDILPGQVVYIDGSGYFKGQGTSRATTPAACLDSSGIYLPGGDKICGASQGLVLTEVPEPYDFSAVAPLKPVTQ